MSEELKLGQICPVHHATECCGRIFIKKGLEKELAEAKAEIEKVKLDILGEQAISRLRYLHLERAREALELIKSHKHDSQIPACQFTSGMAEEALAALGRSK